MKTKYIFLVFILLNLSSCYVTEWRSVWSYSSYNPSQHTFDIDTAFTAKYGEELVEKYIKSRIVYGYKVVDSIPDFYFSIIQDDRTIPIIPLFYSVNFHKSNGLYKFRATINNNKIYQSFDSLNYTIYDSLETVYYKGAYNVKIDNILVENKSYTELMPYFMPYTISIKLNKTDTIYGDIDLFFTDINNKPVVKKIRRIKFNYTEGRRLTANFNW